MSKVLRTIAKVATVVAAVAKFIPGVGQVVAAVATAVALVAGTLAAVTAKKPSAPGVSNQFVIDPQAGIPYCIGRTFAGGRIVHVDGYGGAENPYRSYVIAFSGGGPSDSIESVLIDRSPVSVGPGGASGYYSGFMWLSTQLGAKPEASALPAPFAGFPGWGSTHKLSGYAAGLWTLKFDKKGKKFASGQPEFGVVGKWVKVYDPRLDSTFPGGSGPCRALQENTYVWSQNGPLHGLTWALGRWQNSKRALGVGIETQDIDIQAFVDAANVFDANGWAVGGVMDGSGDKWNTLRTILWAGAGEPLDLGGLLSCRYESPKVSLATITGDDLADGDIVVPAMKTWRERINSIIPRYRSEAHNWEIIPASAVRGTTYIAEDGEERTRESEYYCCQSLTQAAQLAAYEIALSREIDGISVPLKTKFIGYKPGDCLTLNIPEANLNNQPAIVTNRTLDPATGIVTMTFRTETTAKHAWALGRTTTAPPSPSITSSAVMDALIWNNRAGIPEERFNPLSTYDFGRIVNLANGARYIYINDTPTAGATPPNATYWSELSTSPSVDVAQSIVGQAWAATNGAQSAVDNNFVVLGDKNRVPFSQFEVTSSAAWYVWAQSAITSPAISYSTISGFKTVTFTAIAGGNGSFGSVRSQRFPVAGGETLSCQVRLSTNGISRAILTLKYFDAAGASIAAQPGVVPEAGISTPAQYQFQGVVAAPSNAVAAEVELFVYSTAAGAMLATMSQPMITGAKLGQVVYPAFTAGPNSFDAADITAGNVAAGYTGQTAWGTYAGDTPSTYQLRVQYLDTGGILSGLDRIANRRMTLLKRADGATDLTEAMAITGLGVAAGYTGQTAWGTYSARAPSYLDVLSKPSANTLYNGGFTQDWKGWNSGGLNLIKDWRGNIVEAPGGTGGTFVAESTVPINVANGQPVTLSAVFTGTATSNALYFVDIRWANGGNAAHIDYSSNTANGCLLYGETATKKLAHQTMTAPNASDGSGFVRGYVRLVSICDVAYVSGTRWMEQVKVETGSTPTPFSDEATDGANLSNATGRIPDSRQLNSNNNFGLRALSETPTFSQTNAGSSVTLDLGSNGKLYSDWGAIITLPSATITGLAFSTTYYVWRNMPSPDGAGSSYGYSTALTDALGVGKVYLGFITTMSSGGSGGGGGGYGGGDCIAANAFAATDAGPLAADSVAAGARLIVLNADLSGTASAFCSNNAEAWAECVTLETTGGIRLTLALNTPMTLPGSLWEVAANMTGKPVAVLDQGRFGWETVTRVAYAGRLRVAKITAGNATYAAGDQSDRFIFSHNIWAKP